MADTLRFTIDDREYKIGKSLLARQSSAPLATWVDELVNATYLGLTQAEIEPFLAAVEGRNSWRLNGMSDIDLSERRAVLRLATRWRFEDLRNLAIDALDKLVAPVEKLVLARAYRIRWWLVPAYTELALRIEPLSVIEARQLDAEDVVRIFSARESIFRQRLPAHEHALSSYFIEVVLDGISSDHVHDTPPPATSSAAPPLSSYQDNGAIIVSDSAPAPSVAHHPVINVTLDAVDISPFIAGKFDAGIALVTAANVHEVANQLCSAPEILFGASPKKTRYKRRGADLVLSALRRSVRQEDFGHTGGQFAGAILEFLRRGLSGYEHPLSHSLQSLDALWGQFLQSGTVPRQDRCKVMPTDLTPDGYRECMRNGRTFIASLIEQGFVREWKWATHACALFPRAHPLSTPHSPTHEPVDTGSVGTTVASPPSHAVPARPRAVYAYHAFRLERQPRLHASKPSISDIVSHLNSRGRLDAGMAWITTGNVDEVFQGYRTHFGVDGQALPDGSHVNLLCALFRRACDDLKFHAAGIKFLVALCEAYPIFMEQVLQPIDWIIESWLQLLQRPDTTPSPDRGKIVRRWQQPGMVPKLYKERIGNVRVFILEALKRQPLSNVSWALRVRESFS